jgi:hypothetical protein
MLVLLFFRIVEFGYHCLPESVNSKAELDGSNQRFLTLIVINIGFKKHIRKISISQFLNLIF